MRYLLLLLIVLPAAEIGVLLYSGKLLGILPTIFMIVLTGIVGAYLAKRQGLKAIREFQEQVSYGIMPGEALLDGICILIGGVLLLTPGFISDVMGFILLAPPTRKPVKWLIAKMLQDSFRKGNIKIIR